MPAKLRETALNLLARREHTAKELSRKLNKKNFEPAEITLLIEKLTQEGLLSNARFIESFIHSRRAKGVGPLRIQAELIERGIKEELIEQALNFADNTWFIEAERVWQKRFKNKKPQDYKAQAQQMRFLQYRGFTSDHIESIFKK